MLCRLACHADRAFVSTTLYDYALQIFEYLGLKPDIGPTTAAEFGAKAARPAYSVLGNNRSEALGIGPLPQWHDALRRHLADRGHL